MALREGFVDEPEELKIYPAKTVAVENMKAKRKIQEETALLRLVSHRRYIKWSKISFDSSSVHVYLKYINHRQSSSVISYTSICPSTTIHTIPQGQPIHTLPKMAGPSFEYAAGTRAPPELTLSTDDTYDWATIQKSRPTAKLLNATAGATLPPFTQKIPYDNPRADTPTSANSTFRVEASPKWFSIVSSELDDEGMMTVTLGVQGGKTLAAGKVVGVVTRWSGAGRMGSGKTREYYYQLQ